MHDCVEIAGFCADVIAEKHVDAINPTERHNPTCLSMLSGFRVIALYSTICGFLRKGGLGKYDLFGESQRCLLINTPTTTGEGIH